MSDLPNWLLTSFATVEEIRAAIETREIAGRDFAQFGQGSGMLGLPGDFTPPSRFVRAAVFSATAIPEANAVRDIFQTFHILNNFDISVGVARDEHDGVLHTDYTMLTTARDPQALEYYWKSYEDQTIRKVDLTGLPLDGERILSVTTAGEQPVLDMTERMNNLLRDHN